MTHLTVPIMVESLEQAHSAAAQAAEHGADLVEYRVDHVLIESVAHPDAAPRPTLDDVLQLVEQSPLPCIVTCRPTWEGGHFEGDDQERIKLWEALGQLGRPPAYLDVELQAYQRSATVREAVNRLIDHPGQVQARSTGLILSSHDFTDRPRDLYQRMEAMVAAPACRVMKVVWMSRSLRDNVEAFEILMRRHKPTVALCMGETGLASRVLAKKFGALLTFAALHASGGTASGQPTVAEIKQLYRWDRIQPDTQVFGVIGHPVGHSMSPAIHNAGFDANETNAVYLQMPIPPEYEHFKATVSTWLALPELQFRGASVTIPHKENLLHFVGEHDHANSAVEPLAKAIGAANTLTVRDDGSLFASNTDYAAALDAVCDGFGIARDGLKGKRVAVIGAGGAARAIVAGFAHYGATVVVYNRTFEKAQALAEQFNGQEDGVGGTTKVVAARLEKLCDSCCHVFINCTPIGMHPNVDDTPIPQPPQADTDKGTGFGPGTVVFDTIYNPIETRLLQEAKAAGCTTISGTEMFVRQAADQFEGWTNQAAPLDVFREVLTKKLAGG